MNPSPELLDRLASEYVLGTLHGGARRRFQRMIRERGDVALAVRDWERRLMPLGGAMEGPAPRAQVWQAIERQIDPSARGAAPAVREPSWFARWFGARGLATLAAGVVVGVAVGLLAPTLRDRVVGPQERAGIQLPESYAGFLADAQGRATVLISSLRHGHLVDIKVLRPVPLAPGERLHLWALAPGAPPRWLGRVPADGKGQLRLPDTSERLLAAVDELAVSVERVDDPPVPTMPFRLRGPCAKFW